MEKQPAFASKPMKQRNKWWGCVVAVVFMPEFHWAPRSKSRTLLE